MQGLMEILEAVAQRYSTWGAVGLALLFSFSVAMLIFAILKDWHNR